jgi:hypothetical protein
MRKLSYLLGLQTVYKVVKHILFNCLGCRSMQNRNIWNNFPADNMKMEIEISLGSTTDLSRPKNTTVVKIKHKTATSNRYHHATKRKIFYRV